jgi:UDP-glucose 4-epimerase
MRILLTGGCGYIGSHTAIALVEAGHEPVLLDNFSNSSSAVVERIGKIAGRPITVVEGDIRNCAFVRSVLADQAIKGVIHFAALKAVAESVADPLSYYLNNIGGLFSLIQAMDGEGVRRIVFSSSATVYGEPERLPVDEDHPTRATNPYGQTKLMGETILSDMVASGANWRVSLLRYFNPVGAHPSGLIGEDPTGIPNNLMPLVTRAANRKMANLQIYGTDYPTADGTAVRDYIHVSDLAEGPVAALNALEQGSPLQVYNLGTGRGTSVLELIDAFRHANNVEHPTVMAELRAGVVAAVYAAAVKAERELGWRSTRSLTEMCLDSWRFAKRTD